LPAGAEAADTTQQDVKHQTRQASKLGSTSRGNNSRATNNSRLVQKAFDRGRRPHAGRLHLPKELLQLTSIEVDGHGVCTHLQESCEGNSLNTSATGCPWYKARLW
jgi:hypothetical protein